MHAPHGVPFHDKRLRRRSPLLPLHDVEIIVRGMPPRMSLGAQRRAEHNQILRQRRMQHVHAPHCAARVVVEPLGGQRGALRRGVVRRGGRGGCRDGGVVREGVGGDGGAVLGAEGGGDVVDDAGGGVGVEGEGVEDEGVH